jgi:PhnB protein
MPVPPGYEDKVIHGHLKAGAIDIMASEGMPGVQVSFGDNVHLSIQGSDLAKMTQIFNGLSAGGRVSMPLQLQFWGDTFGSFTDRFGVHWNVNVTKRPQPRRPAGRKSASPKRGRGSRKTARKSASPKRARGSRKTARRSASPKRARGSRKTTRR